MNKRTLGNKAEDYVCTYLKTKGYKILERNFTIRGGEIDIITQKENIIIFIEVKSLKSEQFIKLEETISYSKKQYLIRSCKIWLNKYKNEETNWRIDFVGVKFASYDKITSLKYITNAIY